MQLGVDEAGKGPVLGSMFVAAVRADPETLPDDVDDSKRLAQPRREELARAIEDRADSVTVTEIPVDRIDDPETDMNELTVAGHAEAVGPVASEGLDCYLDAGDTNTVRFERRVEKRLSTPMNMRAEHGADETYPVVAAASILAKVAREEHVDRLQSRHGEVGSGYPSDGTTREFLREFVREHGRLPDCARESWQTSQDVLAELGQASLSDF